MARQKGIVKLKGTIGDITFYKTQDGHLAREKGGVDASRIKNDPAFQRTRENGSEFGRAGKAGKVCDGHHRKCGDANIRHRCAQKESAAIDVGGPSPGQCPWSLKPGEGGSSDAADIEDRAAMGL